MYSIAKTLTQKLYSWLTVLGNFRSSALIKLFNQQQKPKGFCCGEIDENIKYKINLLPIIM